VPKVPGDPLDPSSADAPGWYGTPFSSTEASLMDSPGRSGISRNPPENGPSKE
jgi:hypothetical protein